MNTLATALFVTALILALVLVTTITIPGGLP